jgi:hypothetical protein
MVRPETNPAALNAVDLSGLSPEIRSALAVLAEVEARYERDRASLVAWQGPNVLKRRFLDQLETRHAQEREPVVQRLAQLHQQMTTASMLHNLRGLTH